MYLPNRSYENCITTSFAKTEIIYCFVSLSIRETIRKDLEVNELDPNMVYDRTLWHNLIHVADPT